MNVVAIRMPPTTCVCARAKADHPGALVCDRRAYATRGPHLLDGLHPLFAVLYVHGFESKDHEGSGHVEAGALINFEDGLHGRIL